MKYHCTHRGQRAIIDAMDIAGGKGICLGPSNFLARNYQGAPIAITVEGANILTRSMIIFGQGAIRCHPYVLTEMAAAADNQLNDFDNALFSHVGHMLTAATRSFWLGLSRGHFSPSPFQDATRRYYQHLNRLSANLALLSDIAMATLGGSLKRRERISARLGDILSQLYLASATLKRFDEDGRPQADLPLVHWAVQDCLYEAEKAMDELLTNFPDRRVAALLRLTVFPTGRHHRPPSDKLDSKLARLLQEPSETRDRIGRGQYLTPEPNNPHGLLNAALSDILAAEPLVDRLSRMAEKHIDFTWLDKLADIALEDGKVTPEEADILRKAEASRLRSINVDEFAPEIIGLKSHANSHRYRKGENPGA